MSKLKIKKIIHFHFYIVQKDIKLITGYHHWGGQLSYRCDALVAFINIKLHARLALPVDLHDLPSGTRRKATRHSVRSHWRLLLKGPTPLSSPPGVRLDPFNRSSIISLKNMNLSTADFISGVLPHKAGSHICAQKESEPMRPFKNFCFFYYSIKKEKLPV